ncbi:hypothetical protein OG875_20770 [Streptomyces sp. NBC_01498]|uniref:hypothetical protein n=1 Tax=Streptomyces sp. NBC_01498 TaxID=2975870 RepID=UPI002E7BA792|nr:hypothetical protein [Streptomyces sp. NBC_01498]WTL26781.1 hypothetical protein OG875_20770 [Streptomyces sp. NBC_01498]
MSAAPTAPGALAGPAEPADSASDVVRWAAFGCLLVPVVVVVFGTSVGGAAVPALALVAVTAVCRLLLRRAERPLRARRTGARGALDGGGRRR